MGGGMTIRKILFWLHLTAGSLAGIVIFIMSLTGVVLAWQRQIINLADRASLRPPAPVQQARMSPENLLAKAVESGRAVPSTLTIRSDSREPVAAEFGRNSVIYLDPSTGAVLGAGSTAVRGFFRETENWHRWLAAGIESRAAARGVTGACNLLFLGLVLSGLYLWLPKQWSRQKLRLAMWFRRGVTGRARDWNWHNTIGIWCAIPLAVIVACGVVMSYPWANNLVFRMTGTEPPPPGARGGRGVAERGGEVRAADVSFARIESAGIDAAWRRAESQVAGWKSIALRVPANARAPLVFAIDSGNGGRPDLRAQLTLKRGSGDLIKWEPFSAGNAGRRLRSWIRFSHTGEAGGLPGQTIAAVASLGATFLTYTGISLALRRLRAAIGPARRMSRPGELAAGDYPILAPAGADQKQAAPAD
jgi:uncharacterized iron-regulated membrane protein